MKTIGTTYNHERDRRMLVIILSFVIIPVGLLLAFAGLSEFYIIEILKEGDKYPFGLINENTWYYETPELYAKHQLVTGSISLLLSVLVIISLFKKNNKWTLIFSAILTLLAISLLLGF